MFVPEIIIKKKRGCKLSKEEIFFVINGYVDGSIPDYQVSALLMAICLKGMDDEEIGNLCDAMLHSGDIIDLSKIEGIKVDKHSTGGVGDKTSLVLGPMVAALGGKVAKLSGRGLGHTGGTIDKLESIPGFSVGLSIEQFTEQVNKIGLCIIGQTLELDPADKKLYALRDVTGTVDSIPLIATSIMSKKLATGSDAILLDVKYGSGAFFNNVEDSKKLAQCMVNIGKHMHKDTKAVISNMDQPLGNAIGNILEVKEVIETLNGHGPKDLVELCVNAGIIMLKQAKLYDDEEKARQDLLNTLQDGTAFNKFIEFVEAQGGNSEYIKHPELFDKAKYTIKVNSRVNGYVEKINTVGMGEVSVKLGAGRAKKEDSIDFAAGIYCYKKPGARVNIGDTLCVMFTNKENCEDLVEELLDTYSIVGYKTEPLKTIEEIVE